MFPVCHSSAKEQYCLCCTSFLKVRSILGAQGEGEATRACSQNFWNKPSIVRMSPWARSTSYHRLPSALHLIEKHLVAPSETEIILEAKSSAWKICSESLWKPTLQNWPSYKLAFTQFVPSNLVNFSTNKESSLSSGKRALEKYHTWHICRNKYMGIQQTT